MYPFINITSISPYFSALPFLVSLIPHHNRLTHASPRFSDRYKFQKPNDERALNLMNTAACAVMRDLPDLIIAYGVSDEYRCGPPSTERRQLAVDTNA